MSVHIDAGVSQSPLNLRPGINSGAAGMQKGQLPNGNVVEILPEAPSLFEQIAQAAEELSMGSDDGEEKQVEEANKDIDDAFVREKGTLASIMQVGRFMEQMRKSYTGAQLESLAKRILQRGSTAQMREMLDEEFGGDTASQYMMLQYVLSYGQERGESEEQQRMAYEAMLQIEQDTKGGKEALLSSINAANEGYQYGKTPAQVQQFCVGYKDAVLGSGSLTDILQIVLNLMHPSGSDRMKNQTVQMYIDTIQRLIRALGDDMSAIRPSREATKLKVLLKDLQRLQILHTVLENCQKFSIGMHKNFSANIEAGHLMQDVVKISNEKWVTDTQFSNMPPQYEVRGIKATVIFLKGLVVILSDIPVQMFADAETRTTIISAVRQALEEAVRIEEEEEENYIEEVGSLSTVVTTNTTVEEKVAIQKEGKYSNSVKNDL